MVLGDFTLKLSRDSYRKLGQGLQLLARTAREAESELERLLDDHERTAHDAAG